MGSYYVFLWRRLVFPHVIIARVLNTFQNTFCLWRASFSVYVTYLVNKSGYFNSDCEAAAAAGRCAGDQAVLICTRQRPVGREEGINFTLERRSNCHLRICRGDIYISTAKLSVKSQRENILHLWTTLGPWQSRAHSHPPKKQNTGGQTEISHSAHAAVQGQICCSDYSPCSSHTQHSSPADRSRMDWWHLIDILN